MTPRVGILALQGASAAHRAAFAELGVDACAVRSADALAGLTHLVLPGGESTTIQHLMRLFALWGAVRTRFLAGELVLFGTCAGAILLARDEGQAPPRLGLLDASLQRNAYGRQIDSFVETLRLEPDGAILRGVFIRAPRIAAVGAGVEVLARRGDEPVAVRTPGIVACTFHPELAGETALHRRFLEEVPVRGSGALRVSRA